MQKSLSRLTAAAALAVFTLTVALASAQQAAAPAAGKPGSEQKHFQRLVGTWDATVTMHGAPSSKAVETNRMMGGTWLISEFKSEMAGEVFEGHAMYGFDPDKKKYVGAWVDTQSTAFQLTEGDLSADGQVLTMSGEMKNPMGAGMVQVKMIDAFSDGDTRLFAMKMPVPGGGADVDLMTIAYKRRK